MESHCRASLPAPHKPRPRCLLSLVLNRLQNNPDANTVHVYIYHSETAMGEGMHPEIIESCPRVFTQRFWDLLPQ